jgi:Predicted nucleoside-diphosphate-sugar epimerases
MSDVLVTGASGALGGSVVLRLLSERRSVRVLSHRASPTAPQGVHVYKGDLATGAGLQEAVTGVDGIIHCASNARDNERFAADITGTRTLLEAVKAANSAEKLPRIVYISFVGVDKIDAPYYKAKLQCEQLIEESGLPYSILRATEFHGLVVDLIKKLGIGTQREVRIPEGLRFQSVDHNEVAARLCKLLREGTEGHVPDMGGPEILTFEQMIQTYLRVLGKQAMVRPEPLPGIPYTAYSSGLNLTPDHRDGRVNWQSYLWSLRDVAR